MLAEKLKSLIKEVPDFPKPGISFKDITPILQYPYLFSDIVDALLSDFSDLQLDYIAGIDSRGFLFGPLMAQKLNVPFIPIRKKGKLPRDTYSSSYDLEYGSATLEIHKGDILPESKVLIHDDLLATGGTARAASDLIHQSGAITAGYSFVISLDFLNGQKVLETQTSKISSLIHY